MDFVIPWVNGNDPEWRKQYIHYKEISGNDKGDTREARFRDWENLEYWFRGVEAFAPWVEKIHFITWGHYPGWLNVSHPKLNIVKHTDFIPEKYLPTFNSRAIALNVHRIHGLSEQYVYFNDDFFVIDRVEKSDFFRDGKPCDMAVSNAMTGDPYSITTLKDTAVINQYFSKHDAIKQSPFKWFNIKYGLQNIRTLLLLPWKHTGFYIYHLPQPSLKSTLNMLWDKEYNLLDEACACKFRNYDSVNAHVQRYWELASNNFCPVNLNRFGRYFDLSEVDLSSVLEVIEKQKKKVIVLNDQNISDFEHTKSEVNNSFHKILPGKCSFEL